MTIEQLLNSATKTLEQAGVESARLDTLVLLEDVLGVGRAHILAHLEQIVPKATEVMLNKKIAQRASHTPLAYIRGQAPFYGREFSVNEHVLVPRPETEALIELFLASRLPKDSVIADIGTGSGCIGITAALEAPGCHVYLYDTDPTALTVARQNAAKLGANVSAQQADLLESIPASTDVILTNLPYVPKIMALNKAAEHEPPHAIFSGADGLDHYKRFWHEVAVLAAKPLYIYTESLPAQHHTTAQLARAAGFYLSATSGFVQAFERL